jgi:hypothetical protein
LNIISLPHVRGGDADEEDVYENIIHQYEEHWK